MSPSIRCTKEYDIHVLPVGGPWDPLRFIDILMTANM